MTTYAGGYYALPTYLIKAGLNKHTASLDQPMSPTMLRCVNTVQRTAWRVNESVLSVMAEAWAAGDHLPGVPMAEDKPLPARLPDDVWATLDVEVKVAHKIRVAAVHGENARAQGKREAFIRKLAIAQDLRGKTIYFPHALDFRGRIYPLPQDLNPQGDDVAKGLLEFAEGKMLTERGRYWLKIAVANAAGQDKASFEDRILWVRNHEAEIRDSALYPLDGRRAWMEGDEPWMLLALCMAYVEDQMGLPVHVPIHVDATCSGIQHLSAMGRDPVGGKATNLTPSGKREDLYSEVAGAVKRIVARDAANGEDLDQQQASLWLGKVERKTVKRATMTTPYGVTQRGIRDQFIADGHCEGMPHKVYAANYLTKATTEALANTVVAARQVMDWFQGVARALAEKSIPMQWTTPAGLKVQQSYTNFRLSEVWTLWARVNKVVEDEGLGLNTRKQSQSAAPNVVHSFDAAHLAYTVLAAADEGLTDFALIHDSFGTHANDMDTLQRVIRETFVQIYSVDRLAMFEAEVRSYAPDVELPERPSLGTLDISGVLASPYFFS